MSLHINGEPVHLQQLPAWQWWVASGGGVWAGVLLVIALPLAIGLLLALGGLGLFALLAALLLALGLLLALLLWPLSLAALLLWWLLRRRRARTDTIAPMNEPRQPLPPAPCSPTTSG